MKTIEQILTPDELKRLAEPNEFKQVFGAMHIFGIGNFSMAGRVSLVGDELGGDHLKIQNRRISMHDQDILLGNLPSCRQECIGKLGFYALTNNRRIVVLPPSRGYETLFSHGYLVRSGHAQFAVRQFPHLKQDRFFNETFMWIEPVISDKNTIHNMMLKQGIPGWLNWSINHDSYACIGFNNSQWETIWNMLNIWIPE